MIKIDGNLIQNARFPDGTALVNYLPTGYAYIFRDINGKIVRSPGVKSIATITWLYDSDDELNVVYYLARHLQGKGMLVRLVLPYIPNARMDRTELPEDVFTLKYFSEIINAIGFTEVVVLDPHSSVATALLNNAKVIYPFGLLEKSVLEIEKIHNCSAFVVLPDIGSVKRWESTKRTFNRPYAFGIKHRDWSTGAINGLELMGNISEDAPAVIFDDICSRGGTFLHTAKALKDKGVKNVYLFITHCENTILDGDLINSGLINRIYTTSSIFRRNHPLITVYDVEAII